MQTSTRGGRSDAEQKALAVMPCTSPSAVSTVITVTPLAKRPRAALNSLGVTRSVMRCGSDAKPDPVVNIPPSYYARHEGGALMGSLRSTSEENPTTDY